MRRAAAALLLAAMPSLAAAQPLPGPVRAALESAGVPLSSVGAVVEPASGGRPLVSHRANAPGNPASVMKLLTSYAALDLLGPAFTFRTDVLLAGRLRGGVLDGDLVLRGGGDPKLTYERLWQLAHQLRARGLREVRGDVIVDRGYFAPAAYDPGAFDGQPRRAYNAAPDALLVNFDVIDFTFVPEDGSVRVAAEPDLPNVQVVSRVRLVPGPCEAWRPGVHYDVRDDGLVATVAFSGSYPEECGERSLPLSVFGDARFLESVWRWVWSEAGGVLRGRVVDGPTPPGARLYYRHESEPLAQLLRDMNKYSNNVMARDIFLALSAERHGGGGNVAESARILREWLADKGIAAHGLVVDNGAGLSREARVTAGTLAALLRSAWTSGTMPELAASLPIFAVDGTFADRPAYEAMGRAHVKGGTLTGVQCMAGYVVDAAGRHWIVVMMVNGERANAAQPALDALLEWVSSR